MKDVVIVTSGRQCGKTSLYEAIIDRAIEIARTHPISLSVAVTMAADELINVGDRNKEEQWLEDD